MISEIMKSHRGRVLKKKIHTVFHVQLVAKCRSILLYKPLKQYVMRKSLTRFWIEGLYSFFVFYLRVNLFGYSVLSVIFSNLLKWRYTCNCFLKSTVKYKLHTQYNCVSSEYVHVYFLLFKLRFCMKITSCLAIRPLCCRKHTFHLYFSLLCWLKHLLVKHLYVFTGCANKTIYW